MRKKRHVLFATLASILLLLAACESDKPQKQSENQPKKEVPAQPEPSKEMAETEDEQDITADKDKDETAEKEVPADETNNLKDEYLLRLNETKQKTDHMRENPEDDTTFAMKKAEGDIYDIWDGLLNEIYGVLQKQLPAEKMDQLRNEQREWIKSRDQKAKEASLKYEGGTMEQLEYVAVENKLAEARCFELVENYLN